MSEFGGQQPAPQQVLDLGVNTEGVFNEIEMGVLQNGISYLTQNGLARICGVHRSNIADISREWEESFRHGVFARGRMEFISSYLQREQYNEPTLYIPINKDGSVHYAYPEVVCMAILEFYAFVSQSAATPTALQFFRELSRAGMRGYIYTALGYIPDDPWRHYHSRVSIMHGANSVPAGHFIVFNEIAGLMVDLIHAGLAVNQYTVPDISVGQHWARYWSSSNYDATIGPRQRCQHYYPEEFNQSASNPQMVYAYPDNALAVFRHWLRAVYLPTKFPKYLLSKAGLLAGGQTAALQIIDNFNNRALPNP
ncbi:hypothetical protein K3H60_003281 [Escherichia coli]|nr:hypothetical protein [Escherichia coli]